MKFDKAIPTLRRHTRALPTDPSILRLLEQLADLQYYPMPRSKATSIDIAEQKAQWRDRARLYLADLIERARALNDVVPSTDKANIGEFTDVMRDAIDSIVGQFQMAEDALEEEEQAA
jgi:hypothetical protein